MVDADVIVVGFRCAGAPLALALHRAGVRVVVVDRDPLFSNQELSTHAIQPYGMKMLDELGLGDVVRGLAPPGRALRFQVDDDYMQIDLDGAGLDSRSPRRSRLDPALQRAVLAEGVEVRDRTRVSDLLWSDGRVSGVRVAGNGREYELRAPLVVGADGRNSIVAHRVGAPTYLESTSPNGVYWSYFEQTPVFDDDPRYDWGACIHLEGREMRAVFQTDSGLLLMAGGGPRHLIDGWSGDPETALWEHLRCGRLTRPLMPGTKMVAKPIGVRSVHTFVKQAVGPGWALVGDSGLHLDPTPGLGISDAVRDAVALAKAIVDGSERALTLYWRRRDADSLGLYYFAEQMGAEDYNNALTQMIFKRVQRSPTMRERMVGMTTREIRPQDMVPPTKLFGWLVAEAFHGNLAPWAYLGPTLRLGMKVVRHQAVLERALAAAERGQMDYAVPVLA